MPVGKITICWVGAGMMMRLSNKMIRSLISHFDGLILILNLSLILKSNA
jgi:hypothetical protein